MSRIFENVNRRRGVVGAAALVMACTVALAGAGCAGSSRASSHGKTAAPDANASDQWPITECGTSSGRMCAATNTRVDLDRPTFSDPTHIDNPLFPVSSVESAVQIGKVDGKPFRSETTTLAKTGVVDWYGTEIPVVLSQYVAYLDGQIEEVALDRYAQADDGSVWYFGEDVTDYRDGSAYLTEGTWLAGRDGPPAMVMPARPRLGDVFRVENVIGIVFEELTVVEQGKTLPGPNGPLQGAIVVDELGVDGGHSRKILAPGYGEFMTGNDSELEAMAVATPTDHLPGGVTVEIRKLLTASWGTMEYVRLDEWGLARASLRRIQSQLRALERTQQPPRVMTLVHGAVNRLEEAVRPRDARAAERATVELAQATIDLESRYLDATDVEVARFHLHAQRLRVDAAAGDAARVRGGVVALEQIRERISAALGEGELADLDRGLDALRLAADSGHLGAAADRAIRLASSVRNDIAS